MTVLTVVNVVAGIIYNGDRTKVLLSKRKPEQHQGGLWEFPGGKVEASEDQQSALARELKEELNIQPGSASFYTDVRHDYADKRVHLWFWEVCNIQGEPKGCEQQEWQWWEIRRLHELEFPTANRCVVDKILLGD